MVIFSPMCSLFSWYLHYLFFITHSPPLSLLWSPYAFGETDPPTLLQGKGLKLLFVVINILPPSATVIGSHLGMGHHMDQWEARRSLQSHSGEESPKFSKKVSGSNCLPPDVRQKPTPAILQLCRKPTLGWSWVCGWQPTGLTNSKAQPISGLCSFLRHELP